MANTFNHNGKVVINDSGQMSVNTTSVPYVDDKLLVSGNIIIENNGSYLQYSSAGARVSVIYLNNSNNINVGQSNVNHGSLNLYGGTGVVTINAGASEVARFTTAGNVGIGTTSPTEKLHVYGTGNQIIKIENSGTYLMYLGLVSNEGYIGSSNATPLTFYTNNVSRMYITTGGNVGIGTTAPKQKLIVEGTLATKPSGVDGYYSYLRSNWAENNAFELGISEDGASNFHKLITSSNYYYGSTLQFWTSDTEKMRITSAGNVGIGTTAPSSILHVDGVDPYVRINNVNSGNNQGIKISYNYSDTHGFHLSYNPNAAGAYIDNTYPITSGQAWGDIYFRQNNGTGTMLTRMTIKADGGNVGIGTTAPAYKLDVIGQAQFVSGIVTNTGTPVKMIVSGGILNDSTEFRTGNGEFKIYSGRFNAAHQSFVFATGDNYTSGAERMRITSAGNVGIGTTAPTYKLSVQSTDTAGATGTGATLQLLSDTTAVANKGGSVIFGDAGNFVRAMIKGMYIGPAGSGGGLAFSTAEDSGGAITERMRLNSTGNVGIGTVSPISKLEISGPTGSYSSGIGFSATGTGARTYRTYIGTNGYFYFDDATGGSSRLTIDTSGNVGIGTTNPGAKLEVVKDYAGSIEAEMANFYNPSQGNGNYNYITVGKSKVANNNAVFGFTQEASASRAWIGLWGDNVSGGVGLTVLKGGNVGIGTTSPTQKLDVTGNVKVGDGSADNYVKSIFSDGTETRMHGYGFYMSRTNSYIRPTNDGTQILAIGTDNHTWNYVAIDANYFTISTNASEHLRVTSAGNVGIGTTAPTVPLQIVKDNATISMTNTTAFAVDTGSRLFLGGKYSSGTSNNTTPFAWIVGAKENATDGNQAGYLSITTVANGGGFAERMRVTSAGNVGIGTTSPQQRLMVASPSDTSVVLGASYLSTNNNNFFEVGINANDGYLNLRNSGVSTTVHIDSDGNSYLNGGNVGIGTTNPGTRLSIQNSGTTDSIISEYRMTNGSNAVTFRTDDNVIFGIHAQNSGDIYIKDTSGNVLFYGKNGGNVGIGTTAPGAKLHVAGDGRFEGSLDLGHGSASEYSLEIGASRTGDGFAYVDLIGDTTYPDYGLRMIRNNGGANTSSAITHRGTGSLLIETNEAAPIVFNTLAAERMRILSGGNVGIGTTAPTNRLTVTTATNAVDVLRLNNTGGDSGAVQGVTHLAINHFNSGTNPSTRITAYQDSTSGWPGGMYFSTRSLNTDSAPLERMRITSAGNVGIGTTSPQYMLDVNGDAQINAQGSGPDYAYVPDGAFGVDSLLTSGSENIALGEPDVWLRIHVDGVAFVFPGYQEQ
jgi:hypothetical protein